MTVTPFQDTVLWATKERKDWEICYFQLRLIWHCTPSEMKFLVFGSSKQGKEKSILKFFALSYHDTV